MLLKKQNLTINLCTLHGLRIVYYISRNKVNSLSNTGCYCIRHHFIKVNRILSRTWVKQTGPCISPRAANSLHLPVCVKHQSVFEGSYYFIHLCCCLFNNWKLYLIHNIQRV